MKGNSTKWNGMEWFQLKSLARWGSDVKLKMFENLQHVVNVGYRYSLEGGIGAVSKCGWWRSSGFLMRISESSGKSMREEAMF